MSKQARENCLCPKCGRTLTQSGELTINLPNGTCATVATFQCDECLVSVDFAGEPMDVALTFARRPDGTLFDPADPDSELRL